MKKLIAIIIKIVRHFHSDSLYRNSIYLMLSTAVMAFFGFFFWIINARLYSTEQIGIATAMISILNLIMTFSLLGLNTGIIRYLPTSESKNAFINTVVIIVGLAAFFIIIFYVLFLPIFSPKLLFIRDDIVLLTIFIGLITLAAVNSISESIFTAYRSAKYVLIHNVFYSISKVILPFFFITFGAYGIFISYSGGVLVAICVTLYFLYAKFNYKFFLTFNKASLARVAKFSFANYTAGFIGGLPGLLLPIIILNKLGSAESAYFYMSMMIAGILFIIPTSISSALFSESSHDEANLNHLVKKAFKLTFMFAYPSILIVILLGNYILLFFGKEYSNEGFFFLQLISASCLISSINSIFGIILRLKNRIYVLNFIATLSSLLLLGLSYLMLDLKLAGIGYAWLISQILLSGIYLYFLKDIILKTLKQKYAKA